jgi:general secretion pathway protein A
VGQALKMYQSFYGLKKRPFVLTPDPGFLVMTDAHCNAKSGLMYAILGGKGFAVLTGDAGTGKTTLLRSVINSIPAEKMCFSLVVNPDLTPDDFYDMAVSDFGLPKGMSKPDRLRRLQDHLLEVHAEGKIAVLFVDEAHRLSPETLEEIRLLSNFETESEKLLQIVLVGQDELDELLDRRELRQLKQRVEVRLHIGPLSPEETRVYIAHRWKVAGGAEVPFTRSAIQTIVQCSGGVPRLINTICDNALLIGFAESTPVVTEQHILEASEDLHLGKPMEKHAGRRAEQRPAAPSIDLQVPAPVFHSHSEHPLSLFGIHKPKRAWWRAS